MPSRRGFIAAAAAGAAFLPGALAQALTVPARRVHGTIQDVEHVVILMQENRAFDHYFGTLRGVRGYDDPCALSLPSGSSVFHQPVAPGVAEAVLPFRLNSQTTSAECMASLDHSWKGQHSLWRNHDAWVPVKGPLTMGYFTREDIPFYYALADAFTICDAYHCSVFGPTNPNRLFLFSGTSGLSVGQSGVQVAANADDGNWTADPSRDVADFEAYGWTTYAERLQNAGISWKLYQEFDNFGDNSLAFFKAFRGLASDHPLYARGRAWVDGSGPWNADASHGEHLIAAFAQDVAADRLAQVSWLVAPTKACEHPDASPGYGEAFTARLIAALAANPAVFAKTVFILNYDENDGFFDHVPPPTPATTPELGASTVAVGDEVYGGQPVGLGPRVPMILVSPWSRGGWVDSQLFDHTSVLRFLEARFGVIEPNISAWRRAVTGDLTSAFDFAGVDPTPPRLPSTEAVAAQVEAACRLSGPKPDPAVQAPPRQEPGQRPARALPYVLHVRAEITETGGPVALTFENAGAAGAHFTVHAKGSFAGPWYYTVEAGKTLTAKLPAPWNTAGGYDFTVFGPNGFQRAFRGRAVAAKPGVFIAYRPQARQILLRLSNTTN
ncbi:MAG: phospholipase C, phosphocholine-specific, partial [Caulobacteraceae bacterium]|nr:phospholipase C, phosphocholine-specific [Caulobacteraceae bacterium]